VREQVAERDRPGRRLRVVEGAGGRPHHPHGRELRRPAGDRVVEREVARFEKGERSHRGDRLRHRGDAKEGVAPHGTGVVEVADAGAGRVDDTSAAPDERGGAGQMALVDERLNGIDHGGKNRCVRHSQNIGDL
jgi:hypothetical protein